MRKIFLLLPGILFCGLSCNRPSGSGEDASGTEESGGSDMGYRLEKVWSSDTTLRTPESCYFDKERNVIYVSNVNLEPRMKDGNGFISRLSVEGEILERSWISGLSSPKGMAMVGSMLYVTDVDELVEMDVETGGITNRWMIDDSGMLNDITADDQGALYISDSDKNRIIKFANGTYEVWLDEGIQGPNGLWFEPDRLLLASMGSQDFTSIAYDTRAISVIADSIGAGDGVICTGSPENYVVSDWAGRIFYIYPDGSKELLYQVPNDQEQTADVGFIEKDQLLLVPNFFANRVTAYRLVRGS